MRAEKRESAFQAISRHPAINLARKSGDATKKEAPSQTVRNTRFALSSTNSLVRIERHREMELFPPERRKGDAWTQRRAAAGTLDTHLGLGTNSGTAASRTAASAAGQVLSHTNQQEGPWQRTLPRPAWRASCPFCSRKAVLSRDRGPDRYPDATATGHFSAAVAAGEYSDRESPRALLSNDGV